MKLFRTKIHDVSVGLITRSNPSEINPPEWKHKNITAYLCLTVTCFVGRLCCRLERGRWNIYWLRLAKWRQAYNCRSCSLRNNDILLTSFSYFNFHTFALINKILIKQQIFAQQSNDFFNHFRRFFADIFHVPFKKYF